jgi:hypothetical protein
MSVLEFHLSGLSITINPLKQLIENYSPVPDGKLTGIDVNVNVPLSRMKNLFTFKSGNASTVQIFNAQTKINSYTGNFLPLDDDNNEVFLAEAAIYDTAQNTGLNSIEQSVRRGTGTNLPANMLDVYIARLALSLFEDMSRDGSFKDVEVYSQELYVSIEDKFRELVNELAATGYININDQGDTNVSGRVANYILENDYERFGETLTLNNIGETSMPFIVGDKVFSNVAIAITNAQKEAVGLVIDDPLAEEEIVEIRLIMTLVADSY